MTKKEDYNRKFNIANDLDFYEAIMEAVDGAAPGQKNPIQTIGDRIRLIKCLEKHGYTIVKK